MATPEDVHGAFEAAAAALAAQLAAKKVETAAPPAEPEADDELGGLDMASLDAALAMLDAAAPPEAEAEAAPGAAAPASALSEELRQKIVKQVEYYFGDENLPNDEFLLSRVKQNKQGWGAPPAAQGPCGQRRGAARCATRAATRRRGPPAPGSGAFAGRCRRRR